MKHTDQKLCGAEPTAEIPAGTEAGGKAKTKTVGGEKCQVGNRVREAAPKYGTVQSAVSKNPGEWDRQGEYTLKDYYALPDDLRVELIDGVFFVMNAPTVRHQVLGDEIQNIFSAYIRKNKGKCLAVTSPVDVQLDQDDKTMVEPDVIIVCDREKLKRGIVYGAPDLVVEVLSKSTRNRDLFLKLNKYHDAGVREYWVVDPKLKAVTVYKFDGEIQIETYDTCAKIPVGIFHDECVVDFGEIFEYAGFLEEAE